MNGRLSRILLAAAAVLFPFAVDADVEINGNNMKYTSIQDYCDCIKYLTVSPDKRTLPAFTNCANDTAATKALENNIRREIWKRMESVLGETFVYATCAEAESLFSMRLYAIENMKGMTSGAIDYGYARNADPKQVASIKWEIVTLNVVGKNKKVRVFGLKNGEETYAGMIDLFVGKVRGECAGAAIACIANAAARANGAAAFNAMHPSPPAEPFVMWWGPGTAFKHHVNDAVDRTEIIPGDRVYVQNRPDYAKIMDKLNKSSAWKGINLIYLGQGKYTGLGMETTGKTLDEIKAEMKAVYTKNTNKTWQPSWDASITVEDIQRIRLKPPAGQLALAGGRLDTGEDADDIDGESAASTAPLRFALYQNHPNPFNPTTQIGFDLDRADAVDLSIYDIKGSLVRELVGRRMEPGPYSETWDGKDQHGRDVASGVYFYRLQAGTRTLTRKLILLR
jgi:hypothetical protein